MKDIIYVMLLLIQLSLALFAVNTQEIKITQLERDLNVSQTSFKIHSETVKLLSNKVEELKTANHCLLSAMDMPARVRAITATPLPKMIIK